jgi:hypothetical protein
MLPTKKDIKAPRMKKLPITRYTKLPAICLLAGSFAVAVFSRDMTTNNAETVFEPRSAPGAGQAFLEKFAGDWDVEKVFYPRDGVPIVTRGKCHQAMINDGRFLESDFTFYNSPTNITGIGIIGFEPATGLFTSTWADSHSTKMSIRRSREPFNGSVIVLFSQSLDGDTRQRHGSRTETHLENDGRKIVHQQYIVSSNGKERMIFQLILIKKGNN